jgi:Family of unknown function (DUF6081)
MTVLEYDTFTSGAVDGHKWQVLQLPTPDGDLWSYGDPEARVEARDGTMQITVDPFRLKHDKVHMLDDPKHLLVTPEPIALAKGSATTISVEMACETYNGNPDDLLDGMIGLVVGDFSTGMIFDWVLSATRAGVIYERLPIPGVTPEGGGFSYVVQSPFVALNSPGRFRRYEVTLDGRAATCEWRVEGRSFYRAHGIPVAVASVTLGLIVCTLLPPDPDRGSVSVHGQGARGSWRRLTVTAGS